MKINEKHDGKVIKSLDSLIGCIIHSCRTTTFDSSGNQQVYLSTSGPDYFISLDDKITGVSSVVLTTIGSNSLSIENHPWIIDSTIINAYTYLDDETGDERLMIKTSNEICTIGGNFVDGTLVKMYVLVE